METEMPKPITSAAPMTVMVPRSSLAKRVAGLAVRDVARILLYALEGLAEIPLLPATILALVIQDNYTFKGMGFEIDEYVKRGGFKAPDGNPFGLRMHYARQDVIRWVYFFPYTAAKAWWQSLMRRAKEAENENAQGTNSRSSQNP